MKYRLELAAGVVLAGVMLVAAGMVMAMVFFNVQAGAVNEHTDGLSARSPAQVEALEAELERERLAAEKAQLQRQREVARRQEERRMRLLFESELQQGFEAQYAVDTPE